MIIILQFSLQSVELEAHAAMRVTQPSKCSKVSFLTCCYTEEWGYMRRTRCPQFSFAPLLAFVLPCLEVQETAHFEAQ